LVRQDGVDFKPALITSAVAHVVFILFLTVRAYFFPSEPLQLESAIRVDIVGLPEKTAVLPPPIEEPAAKAAAPAPSTTKELPPLVKEVPKKTEPVVLKPTKPDPKQQKKNQDAALKRLEAMAKLDRMARTEAATKALADAAKAQAAVRGNQLSKGSSLSGLTRLDHAKYLDDLEARIKNNWHPPKFLANAKLRVRVVLMIDPTGSILKKMIVQSSGNNVFDESAMNAVEGSMPLPPPPESLHGILANQGVELDLEPNGFR
jgi:colicin import membrane protein